MDRCSVTTLGCGSILRNLLNLAKDLPKTVMAGRMACRSVVVAVAMLPFGAMAEQYTCIGGSKEGIQITASSLAEAEARGEELRKPGYKKGIRCVPAASDDVFVRDVRFKNNSQVRSFVPSDLKVVGKRIRCDSTGGFLPDGEPNAGSCEEFSSQSTGTNWKVRWPYCQGTSGCAAGPSGMITKVWKRKGSSWIEWVEWEWKDGYPVKYVSNEARDYAGAQGSPQSPQPQSDTARSTTPPIPTSVDAVKKSVGDLFKGLTK